MVQAEYEPENEPKNEPTALARVHTPLGPGFAAVDLIYIFSRGSWRHGQDRSQMDKASNLGCNSRLFESHSGDGFYYYFLCFG